VGVVIGATHTHTHARARACCARCAASMTTRAMSVAQRTTRTRTRTRCLSSTSSAWTVPTSTASSFLPARERRRRRGVTRVVRVDAREDEQYSMTTSSSSSVAVDGGLSRRWVVTSGAALAATLATRARDARADTITTNSAAREFKQTFPTLFRPFIGQGTKVTVKRELVPDKLWALEQNIELGPLETTIRCVVARLDDGSLWVHAPLAPTREFFEMVESCASASSPSAVKYVVVPTYALEHKIFTKDALKRWSDASLYAAPGQFSFPFSDIGDDVVFGKNVDYVLEGNDLDPRAKVVPWTNEIAFETLEAGTFDVGRKSQTIYETAFFHKATKTLIVTDAVARVPLEPPAANSVDKLLVVSQRSTADPIPEDTPEARQIGFEKTALLVNYFFPEHEELDPANPGTVVWTDGWHDNFKALAGRLIVPPVVRTLLYAQNPPRVRVWVDAVSSRWDFTSIVPAHWEAPIASSPEDFRRAFRFLEDPSLDAFPENDLARGLAPIAKLVIK